MPIYPYRCPACFREFDKFEHANAGGHEHSPCECGATALRVWTVPYACVDNTQPHFNNGLGVEIHNKGDIRDAKKRYADTTGSSLVELGTDTKWRAKRERKPYLTGSELAP